MPAPLPDDARSLTHAGLALVTHRDGSIEAGDASGLYHRDRRIVRRLRFTIDGEPVSALSSSRTGPWSDRIVYGHWRDGADPAALIVRERSLQRGYEETITVSTFGASVAFELGVELEAGQATVYHLDQEVGAADADLLTPLLDTADFVGDGLTLRTAVALAARSEQTMRWRLAIDVDEPRLPAAPTVETSDAGFERVLRTAGWDLQALTVPDPKSGRPFTAAGSPHFLAAFGRDALLASLLAMAAGPERALETLDVLAAHQGVAHDPQTLEEPGRILHELRIGDMGVFGLEPGTPYYGSVDATPLFVVVLAECLAWGAGAARLRPLLPAARAAVDWCREHVDDLGFVQSIPHASGLPNQSWKTSADAMVRPDGSSIEGPTSSVEVQGYVHAALLGLADLEDALGDPTLAVDLRAEADDFAARFRAAFAIPGAHRLAYALDDTGTPLKVRASNVGHLLSTSLVTDADARRLATRLLDDTEFSGWGVRTLATSETAYNPLGYHVGAVWPHDTALTLRGLGQRGFADEARRLAGGLLDLALTLDGQLPELLGGFGRDEHPEPVAYPAGARPQAWAAAVPFQIVTTLLGLRPALHRQEIRVAPLLRNGERLAVRGIRLGGRLLDIVADGSHVTVEGDTRGITIVTPR